MLFYFSEYKRREEFFHLYSKEKVWYTIIKSQQLNRWTHFLKTLPTGILIFDQNNEIVFYNDEIFPALDIESTGENLEASTKAIIGKRLADICTLNCREDESKIAEDQGEPLLVDSSRKTFCWQVFDGNSGVMEKTYEYKLPNGKSKCLQMSKKQIYFQDQDDAVVLTVKDMSTYKELEVANQISQYKSTLLSSTSHELRNPLNGIAVIIIHSRYHRNARFARNPCI